MNEEKRNNHLYKVCMGHKTLKFAIGRVVFAVTRSKNEPAA